MVDDLFNQWSVLWMGGIAPASVAAVVYVRTGQAVFGAWGVLALLVLMYRLAVNLAYVRRRDGFSRMDVWRTRFLVGTWLNGGLTGLSGAYATLNADDLTQLLVAIQLTGFVMGSAVRNCLYPRAAAGSILLAEGALGVACVATGDIYYQFLALLIVMFTLAALSLTKHLYTQTVGTLLASEEKAHLVSKIETSNLELAAANARLESELEIVKRMEAQLEYAAYHDKLTGLANRALFMERMELAVQRVQSGEQRGFAVLFLDFDRFKLTNDTLGHDAGDELLRQIAGRLRRELRASDSGDNRLAANVVSRFGGDEFLLLINDLDEAQTADRIAGRLLEALGPAYHICGTEVHSSASIGIVTSDQCKGPAEAVVRNADVAMFEAKRAGRACSVTFIESMHTRLTRHVNIESELHRAIGSSELSVVYQPIVDLESSRIVSAQALLRWQHPVLGTVEPADFIPISAESDLIIA